MKAPPLRVRIVGHPLVTVPIWVGGVAMLYGCWCAGGDGLVGGIPTAALLIWSGKANQWANSYRAWRRAWNGMAEAPARGPAGWGRTLPVFGLIGLVAYYLASHVDQPGYRFALGWMVAVAGLAAVAGAGRTMWRRAGRGAGRRRNQPVQICPRLSLPVPSLDQAYGALPPHCQVLLGRPAMGVRHG